MMRKLAISTVIAEKEVSRKELANAGVKSFDKQKPGAAGQSPRAKDD